MAEPKPNASSNTPNRALVVLRVFRHAMKFSIIAGLASLLFGLMAWVLGTILPAAGFLGSVLLIFSTLSVGVLIFSVFAWLFIVTFWFSRYSLFALMSLVWSMGLFVALAIVWEENGYLALYGIGTVIFVTIVYILDFDPDHHDAPKNNESF